MIESRHLVKKQLMQHMLFQMEFACLKMKLIELSCFLPPTDFLKLNFCEQLTQLTDFYGEQICG